MRIPLLLVPALAATLGACATSPKSLQGDYAAIQPEQAVANETVGEQVKWGGRIVEVRTEKLYSCFEIVGAPLDFTGRPRKVDRSTGRFIACRSGFYEPQVFAPGRLLTISGRVEGYETRKVGDFDYRYARVAADVVYLWPERPPVEFRPYMGVGFGWYDPWFGRRW